MQITVEEYFCSGLKMVMGVWNLAIEVFLCE
jgi:hypothetical protein